MKNKDILSEQELMKVFGGDGNSGEEDPKEVTTEPIPDEPPLPTP